MKSNSISTYADLEREEIRIKLRLKTQEDAIKTQLKNLPEELLSAGIVKMIGGFLNGNFVNSAVSVIKFLSTFIKGNKDASGTGGGILHLIKSIIKAKFS
ncbi:MAG: hypothetical protein K0R26_2668 [Bacteroidota bacterium]|jgi:hypothetical protein|nr:hypothetical protein [Bacteroidota bacterium]